MTQLRLSLESKVAMSEISIIETGKRDPRMGTLLRLARAMGVELADLTEGIS